MENTLQIVEIPYISISKRYSDIQKVELTYENRFNTIGVEYQYKNYSLFMLSNGFTRASAVGFNVGYLYNF